MALIEPVTSVAKGRFAVKGSKVVTFKAAISLL